MRLRHTTLLSLVVGAVIANALWAKETPPNVVLILADDMGYSDLPKFGKSEIPTPNIDRLATEGVLFTDAYVEAAWPWQWRQAP